MELMNGLLPIILAACAIAAPLSKKLSATVMIFLCYVLILSLLCLLQAPGLAVFELVGAGIIGALFLIAQKKLRRIEREEQEDDDEQAR